jgi:hypothetical protein
MAVAGGEPQHCRLPPLRHGHNEARLRLSAGQPYTFFILKKSVLLFICIFNPVSLFYSLSVWLSSFLCYIKYVGRFECVLDMLLYWICYGTVVIFSVHICLCIYLALFVCQSCHRNLFNFFSCRLIFLFL